MLQRRSEIPENYSFIPAIGSATSQYFGFAGGGTLFTLELTSNGSIVERARHQWMDGLFDVVSVAARIHSVFPKAY